MEVWRVNPDGALRDTYRKLTCVFEMEERAFFERYADTAVQRGVKAYLDACREELRAIWAKVPKSALPFSNVWIAHETAGRIPEGSVLFLGILNTLRTWNYFDLPDSVYGYANTGGFGIDGYISSFMGASSSTSGQALFLRGGRSLAFFYDMNVLGNRHVGRNVRILLVNNGKGTEFRNYMHPGAAFGEAADRLHRRGRSLWQ